jgi:hypothetical protein
MGSAAGARVSAQTCRPVPVEYVLWGAPGQGIVPAFDTPDWYVLDDEVWKIRAAGIATDDGRPLEWMMQIQHKVASHGDACCWLIPLHRETATRLVRLCWRSIVKCCSPARRAAQCARQQHCPRQEDGALVCRLVLAGIVRGAADRWRCIAV